MGPVCGQVFGASPLRAEDLRDYIVLQSILKWVPEFAVNHKEETEGAIERGLKNGNKLIARRALLLLKTVLRCLTMISLTPPSAQGQESLLTVELQWHIPSEDQLVTAIDMAKHFINVMGEYIKHGDRNCQWIAAGIGRAILRGVLSVVSVQDLSPEPETFVQPPLAEFSDPRFSTVYETVIHILFDRLTKITHQKVVRLILRSLNCSLVPRTANTQFTHFMSRESRKLWKMSRLPLMLPFLESMPRSCIFWKAKYLFALRCSTAQVFVTKTIREVFPILYAFVQDPETKVRETAVVTSQSMIGRLPGKFNALFHESIAKMSDPGIGEQELSGLSGSLCALSTQPVDVDMLKLVVGAGLAVCRPLPKDMSDDSPRSLRQVVILILDLLDPFDSRVKAPEFAALRESLAIQAMRCYFEYPADQEAQTYAFTLACTVIVGTPILIKAEIAALFVSVLLTDDLITRDLVMQALAATIEHLIPRVPRRPGVVVSDVTPENYDQVEFRDHAFIGQSKMQPHFLTREQFLDPKVVSRFFTNADERVAVHRMLFEKLMDDKPVLYRLIENLINSQVHREETFSKSRVLFWCTLSRFFGVEFIQAMVDYVDEIGTELPAYQVIGGEVFAGCIHSLKCRPFSQVLQASVVIKKFVKKIMEHCDQIDSLWYCSFYASFMDFDCRRLFWLFDWIIEITPRTPRPISLAIDILLDAALSIPRIRAALGQIVSNLSCDSFEVRECLARALTAIVGLTFDTSKRGRSEESIRILDRFLAYSSDVFLSQFLVEEFYCQSPSAICAGGYVLEHLSEWADIILDKDENEQQLARSGLMGIAKANWLGSVCDLPLTPAAVSDFANTLIDLLLPDKHPWQVQSVLLILTESFLSAVYFFLDDSILEGIIADRAIPGLMNQHPDVQDAAAQVLSFVVKSSTTLSEKLGGVVEIFKGMLINKDSANKRVAGAKGLGSIISGTIMFDEVPSYVVDSFTALTDALEFDSGLEQVITQFFADFWELYDNNLASNVAELLAPFHACLRPSYFS
jgi:hypothetical protein